MAGMSYEPDLDPIRKSSGEANSFNNAWMKHGERLTWTQRIGFAIFSFVCLSFGIYFGTDAVNEFRSGNVWWGIGFCLPTLILLVPGVLGLKNALRFE
jgi:hypothetical protein